VTNLFLNFIYLSVATAGQSSSKIKLIKEKYRRSGRGKND
jgi:hypothetical protein